MAKNTMLYHSIGFILESCYGDSPRYKFLMRPQTVTYRLLITKEILKQYTFFADAFGSNHAAFLHAVAAEIDDLLHRRYDQERIDHWRLQLRNSSITPPDRPNFLKELFAPYYPVDE